MTAQPLPTVEESCGDCKFWSQSLHDTSAGVCLRYPPSISDSRQSIVRPMMSEDEWCGEHRPLTPADSQPLTLAQAMATVLASVAGHTGGYRIVADGDRMVCEPATTSPPHEPPAVSKRIDETKTRPASTPILWTDQHIAEARAVLASIQFIHDHGKPCPPSDPVVD